MPAFEAFVIVLSGLKPVGSHIVDQAGSSGYSAAHAGHYCEFS